MILFFKGVTEKPFDNSLHTLSNNFLLCITAFIRKRAFHFSATLTGYCFGAQRHLPEKFVRLSSHYEGHQVYVQYLRACLSIKQLRIYQHNVSQGSTCYCQG